jgi:hypothetical protein
MNEMDMDFEEPVQPRQVQKRGWPQHQPEEPKRMRRWRRWPVVVAVIAIFFLLPGIVALYADWLWFQEVGYQVIFAKTLMTKLALGLIGGVLVFVFFYGNLRLAAQFSEARARVVRLDEEQVVEINPGQVIGRLALPVSVLIGVLAGLSIAGQWFTWLQYRYALPVGEADPIFHRDLGFYFFTLPLLEFVGNGGLMLVMLTIIATAIFYGLRGAVSADRQGVLMDRAAKVHLSVLGSVMFLLLAFKAYLGRPGLLYSTRGPMAGASYTDIEAALPMLGVLMWVALVGAALVIANIFRRRNGLLYLALGLYLGMRILGVWAYPESMQRFIVAPNELVKETPYIIHNIAATRKAFGLDQVEERELSGEGSLTQSDISESEATIKNIRLWDRGPLLDTFSQIQEIRTYYEFDSVDVDRYQIDGEYRQVMLSAREMASDSLPNRNWITERLTFTHGFGLTLSPVNQITSEGLPVLLIKDIPPKSTGSSLQIERPEIYFGEQASDYAIVKTRQKEFDYPSGEENVYGAYAGVSGVPIGSFMRKTLFAIHFGSMKILLSDDLSDESRIIYYRNIHERVRQVAPFLHYDQDPYMVIAGGRLYWIYDAYTVTDRYPYGAFAEFLGDRINYVRNSVKVVIDAYHGQMQFYIADPRDPLIQTFNRIFPGVFRSLDDMPAELRPHIQYPKDLFAAQIAMYSTYHMENPQVFYNKEDQWEIPMLPAGDKRELMEPYHTIMKLPGESREEFILMLPFTPRRKDNLAAWVVGRSDDPNYGRLVVYRFPKQKLVYGPNQIMARINQEAEISRQLTLWDQRGSQVILGTLLVIPVKESLIYVQPLYLKAQTGKIPELKRVIAAYENQIAMEETLEKSLARIFGGEATPAPAPQAPAETTTTAPSSAEERLTKAREHYDRALRALREGNWALYGEETKRLGEVLQRGR